MAKVNELEIVNPSDLLADLLGAAVVFLFALGM